MSVNKPYPKIYRVVLNSANARYLNGEFAFEVNLPLFDYNNTRVGWLLGVESFFTSSTIAGIALNGTGTFANLHLRELSQITSYASDRKANTDVLLTFNNSAVVNSYVTESISMPIVDETFFINKTLTFYFSNSTLTKTTEPQNSAFQIVLNIWKTDV